MPVPDPLEIMDLIPTILYDVIVTPVEYIIEFTYSYLLRLVVDPGWAIVGVSLVVNTLALPLYRMADAQQAAERDRQASMAHWVSHIKEHFKGDEQYMMLTTYYRQCGYKQYYALSSSISLLLQIPIFMAAYNYLSGLTSLKGTPFLFINDLGAPDALLTIGGVTLNVLPIVMTLINCGSTFVYTRGFPLKDKIQPYALAALFLVLLYKSPAGLVFYWTCNQVYSLLKNLVFKIDFKNKAVRGVTAILVELVYAACAVALYRLGIVVRMRHFVLLLVSFVVVQYFVWTLIKGRGKSLTARLEGTGGVSPVPAFMLSALLLAALLGVLIPSALIGDSPTEFAMIETPLLYIRYTACVYLGLFAVWFGAYFFLAKGAARGALGFAVWAMAIISLIDYMLYGTNLGIINTSLVYAEEVVFSGEEVINNTLMVAVVLALLVFVWHYKRQLASPIAAILLISTIGLSVPNIQDIRAAFAPGGEATVAAAEQQQEADEAAAEAAGRRSTDKELSPEPLYTADGQINPLIKLDKNGRNVIVFFIDRAIGTQVPYIFNERPELASKFEGFTYYPNTISYGMWTMVGAPALAGGYEYTPTKLAERNEELLRTKHDEALKVLPKIFSENGFSTTVLDPPLVDYVFSAINFDTFKDIDDVHVYRTAGAYTQFVVEDDSALYERNRYRSFVYYSLFKAVPVVAKEFVYDEGAYFSTIVNHAANPTFLDEYSSLKSLPALTKVEEGTGDNYVFLQNQTPHEADLLQLPDYTPSTFVYNGAFYDESNYTLDGRTQHMDGWGQFWTYCSNAATYLQLANWFDYLREQGVYDNTRIILVSDHGYKLKQYDDLILNEDVDIESVNCLLMVKDFDAHGDMETDNQFMTNADTPTLALDGIVENPVNPYTGNPITSDAKKGEQTVYFTVVWDSNAHREETAFDFGEGYLYTVHDNIFDRNNWKLVAEPTTTKEWK